MPVAVVNSVRSEPGHESGPAGAGAAKGAVPWESVAGIGEVVLANGPAMEEGTAAPPVDRDMGDPVDRGPTETVELANGPAMELVLPETPVARAPVDKGPTEAEVELANGPAMEDVLLDTPVARGRATGEAPVTKGAPVPSGAAGTEVLFEYGPNPELGAIPPDDCAIVAVLKYVSFKYHSTNTNIYPYAKLITAKPTFLENNMARSRWR